VTDGGAVEKRQYTGDADGRSNGSVVIVKAGSVGVVVVLFGRQMSGAGWRAPRG